MNVQRDEEMSGRADCCEGAAMPVGASYTDLNACIIDAWIEDGWEWGIPIDHERFTAAVAGDWSMLLTPTRPVPRDWLFADMRGCRVLGSPRAAGSRFRFLRRWEPCARCSTIPSAR